MIKVWVGPVLQYLSLKFLQIYDWVFSQSLELKQNVLGKWPREHRWQVWFKIFLNEKPSRRVDRKHINIHTIQIIFILAHVWLAKQKQKPFNFNQQKMLNDRNSFKMFSISQHLSISTIPSYFSNILHYSTCLLNY